MGSVVSSSHSDKGSGSILSEREFRHIIRLERSRSDRTGAHFCLVVFHVEGPSVLLQDALKRRTRLADRVGWFRGGELAVLLPKTESDGASSLGSDVVERMDGGRGAVSFRVVCYPSPEGAAGQEQETVFSPLDEELEPACAVPIPVWKRAMDVTGAALLLVALTPLLALLSLYIRIVSAGPLVFRQKRIGYRGRAFTIYKFRTMTHESDQSGHASYLKNLITADQPMTKLDSGPGGRDPRLIPGAAVIRKLALDELPQLVNILKGDMSLVGPRPCIPYEAKEYLRWHTRRFDVVPGLTGLWQVSGKNRLSFKEMIRLDNKYARKMSFWLDLWILAMTPIALLIMVGEAVAARLRSRPGTGGN